VIGDGGIGNKREKLRNGTGAVVGSDVFVINNMLNNKQFY